MGRIQRVLTGGVVALLAFAAAATATIPQPGKFTGTTSQTYPDGSLGTVKVKMTHGGQTIKSFDITWLAACDSGFSTLSQGTHAEGTVSSRGKFHGAGNYVSDKGTLVGTEFTAAVSDRLKGKFVSKTKARGTFEATAVLRDAGGQQVSTCTSPRINWRAEHR